MTIKNYLILSVIACSIAGCGSTNMSEADAEFLIRQGGQMYSNAIGNNQASLSSSMSIYDQNGNIVGTIDNGYIYNNQSITIGYVTGDSVYNMRSQYVGRLRGNVIES